MKDIHKIIIGSALVAGTFLAIDYFYNRKREEEEEDRLLEEKLVDIHESFSRDLARRGEEFQKMVNATIEKSNAEFKKKIEEMREYSKDNDSNDKEC